MYIKPVVKNEVNGQGKVNIKIRFTHQGKIRYLPTEFWILKTEFDLPKGRVKKNNPISGHINLSLEGKVNEYMKSMGHITFPEDYTIDQLMENIKRSPDADFYTVCEEYIKKLTTAGQRSSVETYSAVYNSLKGIAGTLPFKQITPGFLMDYDYYLREKGLKTNSIGVRMRNIRTIYNIAIDQGIAKLEDYPFRRYKIRKEGTRKRDLGIKIIAKIVTMELSGRPEISRDLFLLSFYLIGMNIVDIYHLKHSDYENGRISYLRSKTGREYSIKVEPEAKALLKKYLGKKNLLWLSEKYTDHKNLSKAVNKDLKYLIPELTYYYARHTWASTASNLGISEDDVSLAMGHASNSVTTIYINYNRSRIDSANRIVLDKLKETLQFATNKE